MKKPGISINRFFRKIFNCLTGENLFINYQVFFTFFRFQQLFISLANNLFLFFPQETFKGRIYFLVAISCVFNKNCILSSIENC